MQFFDSCVWLGGLVFLSMLRSVVHDLKSAMMPYLLPILLNFSDMPGAYGIIADSVSFSYTQPNGLGIFLIAGIYLISDYSQCKPVHN